MNYLDLASVMPVVAIWLADLPREVLPLLSDTARQVALEEFEEFSNVHEAVHVRIVSIPLAESIRDLRWGRWPGSEVGR